MVNFSRAGTAFAAGASVKWGILGAGKISSDYAKAIAITEGADCVAVAARSGDRAKDFARAHGIPTSYGSYEEILEDDGVDVVYVGSIADQHREMATACLMAGKPTVVEKPLALNAREARELVDLARERDTFLLEGIWTRFFPAMDKVNDVIGSGDVGDIVCVQGDFGWNNADCPPGDRIWNPKSGGMTLDIGMYMAHLGQVAYPGSAVAKVQATATKKNGVDQTVLANLAYDKAGADDAAGDDETSSRGMLQFYVTGSANTEERVTIQGTAGRVVLDGPAHVPRRVRVVRDAGRGESTEEAFDFPLPDDAYTTWNYPGSVGFTYEIDAVGDALREGRKECAAFGWEDSVQLAEVIEEVVAQARG